MADAPAAPKAASNAAPKAAPTDARPAAGARAATEREVKLAAAPSFRLPDLNGALDGLVAEPVETRRQQTTYFDTPDLRLARWGCSLRYRDTDGWTVKLPSADAGSMLVREEIRFDGEPRQPPQAAADLLRAYVRTASLGPVTRLRTLRRSVVLREGGGPGTCPGPGPTDADGDGDGGDQVEPADGTPTRTVAEIVDDEVSVMDGRRLAARFRELEIEAADGTPDDVLDGIVAVLREAGAGEPDPTPKYVRALGPRATEAPEITTGDLPTGSTAGTVVRHAIATAVIRLLRHDAVVRLDEDPEGVHQARVATRRLRSDLRTFASLLEPAWGAALNEELKWLAERLGAARDADVLLARLTDRVNLLEGADAHAAERLLEQLAGSRRVAHDELLGALREPRYAELLDRLVEAARHPLLLLEADLPAPAVLPGLVQKPWKKLRKSVKQLDDPPTDEQLHAVRIRAKRLRYAAEAVAPLLGKQARDLAEAAATLQDVLGEHNDAVVAARWLRDAVAGARSVRTAFVAGELGGLERWAAAESRDRWHASWKKLKPKRLHGWM